MPKSEEVLQDAKLDITQLYQHVCHSLNSLNGVTQGSIKGAFKGGLLRGILGV